MPIQNSLSVPPTPNLNRRSFLRQAAAAFGVTALSSELPQAMATADSKDETNRILKEAGVMKTSDIKVIDKFLQSDAVKKSKGAVVMMTADWCEPCRDFKKALAKQIKEKGGLENTDFAGMKIVFIDVTDENNPVSTHNSKVTSLKEHFNTREEISIPRIALLKPDLSISRKNPDDTASRLHIVTENDMPRVVNYIKEMKAATK